LWKKNSIEIGYASIGIKHIDESFSLYEIIETEEGVGRCDAVGQYISI